MGSSFLVMTSYILLICPHSCVCSKLIFLESESRGTRVCGVARFVFGHICTMYLASFRPDSVVWVPSTLTVMAKPLNSSDLPICPADRDISFSGSSLHHSSTRKRTRKSDATTCEETLISCDYPEDNHKTRRVNPQRLAARLAPELVAEMEAYIVPGAKMPNFTVRKDFQERYCVDRRHIYDYFHSRGE